MDKNDWNDFFANNQRYIIKEKQKKLKEYKHVIEEFKKYCKTFDLFLEDNNFDYIRPIGIIVKYPNIISHFLINSDKQKKDKESNLINWNALSKRFLKKAINPGYLYADNYMLMLSPMFRRDFSEHCNWAPRFIELFWKMNYKNIDAYIALDYNRLRINVDNSLCLEKDSWYCPPFNKKINEISDGVGIFRPPLDMDKDIISFLFNKVYSLNISWETKDIIKSFQAIEFKDDSVKTKENGKEYYPARYIHAEFNLSKGYFRHFDGAIHYYTEDNYYARRDANFNYNLQNSQKIKALTKKAFKFNGEIPIDTWMELSSQFFSQNHLLYEYFAGEHLPYLDDYLNKLRAAKNK